MDRVSVYEYDRKNRELVVNAIEKSGGQIFSWTYFAGSQTEYNFPIGTRYVFIDLSSLFYSEDRVGALILQAEIMFNVVQQKQPIDLYVIIERRYSKQAQDWLYHKINGILDLEKFLHVEQNPIQNIVDIDQSEFEDILDYLNQNLFGNDLFKKRLKEELTKYRLFNRIGQQAIFSILICGASGIGKTEVARLLHQKLASEEPMIKINFGNYSAQDALNSLIGSPRGYIGSNKGELPDKLMRSRSKVILIDEFEKASKPVYNFFLQLLEEGKFTDSLGREYRVMDSTSSCISVQLHKDALSSRRISRASSTDISGGGDESWHHTRKVVEQIPSSFAASREEIFLASHLALST